jgi:hypothetical protein
VIKRIALGLCSLALVTGAALAGPNAGGTLIVHATSIVYTDGSPSPCGQSPLTDCVSADTRVDGANVETVWKVYAAFPPSSQPQLQGVVFGIVYDTYNLVVRNSGACGSYDIPMGGWPASNAGITVTWSTPQLGLLTEVCWFEGYCSDGTPGVFRTTPAADGGLFGDGSVPAVLDRIAGYSRLGFNTNGVTVCPGTGETGACCVGGTCTLTAPGACASGVFYGGPCDPTPCSSTGACCVPGQSCTRMADYECNQYGGAFQGVGSSCSPNPCSRGVTTTALVWDNPDPSSVGQPVTAEYSVQAQNGGTPTGTVTVTNGIDSCSGTVAEGQCVLSLSTPGIRLLVATYSGDSNYRPSTADGEPHTALPGPGACCYLCECRFVTEDSCSTLGWQWLGAGSNCNPSPCDCPPSVCCTPEGLCMIMVPYLCQPPNTLWGMGGFCDPNPCPDLTAVAEGERRDRELRIVSVAPNPSSEAVSLAYRLPVDEGFTLSVFTAAGAKVYSLTQGRQAAGGHVLSWDGRDGQGRLLPTGAYLLRLATASGAATGRAILLR